MTTKGRFRNKLCWCGSGKKFKNCHLDRDSQAQESAWSAVDANHKAFEKKFCYACDIGLGPCSGNIIRAHTVSRGSNLNSIATRGHVLRYSVDFAALEKNNGKPEFKLIGIANASVFYGFCAYHDRTIFSCIENEPFTGRADQCLAIAYRTLSREVHGKGAASHLRETLRGADKGRPLEQQIALQHILEIYSIGNEASKRDLKKTYGALTAAISKRKDDKLTSAIFRFNGKLPFMFAGAWSPFTDIFGKTIQYAYLETLLEQVFFSSFASTEGDFICISWWSTPAAPGALIADQISALPSDQQANAFLQIVTKYVENIFFNPEWFEALTKEQRSLIDCLALSGIDMLGSPPSAPLALNVRFQLPSLSKYIPAERQCA